MLRFEREFEVPSGLVDPEHVEDYFWSYRVEFLANEPTSKDDIVSAEADIDFAPRNGLFVFSHRGVREYVYERISIDSAGRIPA